MSRARVLADYVSSGDELAATTTVASAALPKAGGAMTGAITTNSTFDGIDIATRDAVLTSTTTLATAAAPKASPTFTGTVAIPNVANLETAVVANTAKVTNATHTGAVTGGTSLTIADDAVDSQHYAAGSIDNEHLADDAVGTDELANNVVINTSGAITGGAITGIGTNRFSKDDSTPSGTAVSIFSDAVFGSTDTVNTGITVLGTGQTGLVFGNATDSDVGQIRYQHSTNKIEIIAGALISLTAASDDVTVNTGNLVIGTATKGIMFHPHDETVSTPGSDSNLLDDYEEGTWTLSNVSSGGATAYYTKIGNTVSIFFDGNVTFSSATSSLPFTSATSASISCYHADITIGAGYIPNILISGATIYFRKLNQSTGGYTDYTDLTGLFRFNATFRVA